MSKTAQRKREYFKLGLKDATKGGILTGVIKPRYKRTNKNGLGAYRAGFNLGFAYIKRMQKK